MKNLPVWIVFGALLMMPTVSSAQTSDKEAILAVMQDVFAAVHSQNPDDWRALQLPEGTTMSLRNEPGVIPEKGDLRISRNEDFVASWSPGDVEYVERWTADPAVMIRGPIAVVWGEYEFWIDGEFSHCGVDSVDLVKLDGEWKLANIMWTVETKNCPTDPSR